MKLKQPFDFSFGFMVLAFLGGRIGGVFYGLSQESKFECGGCHKVFFSHTTVSRIFLVLCITTYAAIVAMIAYAIWSSYRQS